MPYKDPRSPRARESSRKRRKKCYERHRADRIAYSHAYRRSHLTEVAAAMRAYRKRNPELMAAIDKKRIFGLVPGEVAALLTSQENRCAICRTAEPGKIGWCIDHCHATGVVRGILCAACNKAIGFMADNPESLRAAARYVEEPPAIPVLDRLRKRGPTQLNLIRAKA